MFSDYRIADSTCEAPPVQITFNTAVAATIISLLWLPLAHADERPSGIPDEAKYVKVDRITDGDTIVLMDSTRVRLHGIDTPERDQPYGSEATAALENMVETSVYIVEVDTDRYGRMVGHALPLHRRLRHQRFYGVRWACLVVRTIRSRQ